jgi:hypothetical protein
MTASWPLVVHAYNPTQKAEIRRIEVRTKPGQTVLPDPVLKTAITIGLVEWLKV